MKELTDALAEYLDHVWAGLLLRLGLEDLGCHSPKVFPAPAGARDWFEGFEKDLTWDKLAKNCDRVFGAQKNGERIWRGLIRNWMRRGGVYLSIFDGVRQNPAEVAEALFKDMRTTEDSVVLLAPLEGIGFSKREMNFGDFQIQQLEAAELETLLGTRANQIFYPYAATSTERLTDHWYLRCMIRQGRTLGRVYPAPWFLETFGGPIPPKYTHLPPEIETPLKSIILWDEQESGLGIDYWVSFVSIPFVITVSDNPFRAPRPAPPIESFTSYQTEVFDNKESEVSQKLVDLTAKGTEQFEQFIRIINAQLQAIRLVGTPWGFVDHALNYMLKGFFSDGLDQLIWHVVALEAFFGERSADESVTEQLSKRVAVIHSGDPGRGVVALKEFKTLYKIRCDLVHGRPFKIEVDSRQQWIARRLARRVAIRMVAILGQLASEIGKGGLTDIPSRGEILSMLDAEGVRVKLVELSKVFPRLDS